MNESLRLRESEVPYGIIRLAQGGVQEAPTSRFPPLLILAQPLLLFLFKVLRAETLHIPSPTDARTTSASLCTSMLRNLNSLSLLPFLVSRCHQLPCPPVQTRALTLVVSAIPYAKLFGNQLHHFVQLLPPLSLTWSTPSATVHTS